MRKLNFAHAVQLPPARGPSRRHGRHSSRASRGHGVAPRASRVANRLGRRTALAGRCSDAGTEGPERAKARQRSREQRNASGRPAALCRQRANGSAIRSAANASEIKALRRELRAAQLRRGSRSAGRDPLGGHRPHVRLHAPHRRGQPARVARAMALHRARRHARRARDRAGCGTGLGRCRRRARACRASAARRSRSRRAGATQLLASPASGAARPIALITPGAGWGAKRWPPERYAAVARGLADRGIARPGQRRSRRRVARCAQSPPAAQPRRSAATLPQLIALTRRIALCIAGDTGPLHLACALGRPVVGIYGPTDPSRNGPYGTRARVLRSPGSRRDHSRRSAPDPGLLTIAAGRRAPRRRRVAGRGECPMTIHTPLLQKSAPCNRGRGSRAAFACRWASSPPPSISIRSRAPAPHPTAIAWSLALVLPGLALRAAASGTVKKNRELAVTGPYAYTRNPLYLARRSSPQALRSRCSVGRWRFCSPRVRRHLHSGDRVGRAIPPRHVPRVRRLLPPRAALHPAPHAGQVPQGKRSRPGSSGRYQRCASGGFSLALYLKHREYNAAIGAALLYLSLLFLRPVLELFCTGPGERRSESNEVQSK